MDKSQVRARILEAAQAVKQRLIDQGIAPKAKLSRYKYIDDVDHNLQRLFFCFDLLDPPEGSSVFEIGPGNCYFLVMCRELRGCRMAGVDRNPDPPKGAGQITFRLFREHFGLGDVIKPQTVEGLRPIDFGGAHDAVVATRAHFNRGWGEAEYRFWLRDCYQHLRPGGKLMVHFHELGPEVWAALPLLEPVHPIKDVKKLSLISRETIGQALGT